MQWFRDLRVSSTQRLFQVVSENCCILGIPDCFRMIALLAL